MGVTLSTQSSLAPISLASTIIGFISFAFTLTTWLNVFWTSILTVKNAQGQIHDSLGNLKQGLYEERTHLREVRKRWRKKRQRDRSSGNKEKYESGNEKDALDEDMSTKIMRDTIRHMITRFKELEQPFLEEGRAYYEDTSWADERPSDWYTTPYKACGLRERWIWLRTRKDVLNMMNALSRVQTRRMAKEIGDLSFLIHDMDRDVIEIDERVYSMEQRLSRVVGVRRVE